MAFSKCNLNFCKLTLYTANSQIPAMYGDIITIKSFFGLKFVFGGKSPPHLSSHSGLFWFLFVNNQKCVSATDRLFADLDSSGYLSINFSVQFGCLFL